MNVINLKTSPKGVRNLAACLLVKSRQLSLLIGIAPRVEDHHDIIEVLVDVIDREYYAGVVFAICSRNGSSNLETTLGRG